MNANQIIAIADKFADYFQDANIKTQMLFSLLDLTDEQVNQVEKALVDYPEPAYMSSIGHDINGLARANSDDPEDAIHRSTFLPRLVGRERKVGAR